MTKRTLLCAIPMLAVTFAALTAVTAQESKKPARPASPAFERLKQLAGDWFEADDATKPAEDERGKTGSNEPLIRYKLTGGGSALHETIMPGQPHEMVTMYYLDKGELVLTHYCGLGNQPHMKAEKSDDPNKIVFKFAGGANIDPAKDTHMHDATFTFIDADHFRSEWTLWQDGKPGPTHRFNLVRRK